MFEEGSWLRCLSNDSSFILKNESYLKSAQKDWISVAASDIIQSLNNIKQSKWIQTYKIDLENLKSTFRLLVVNTNFIL